MQLDEYCEGWTSPIEYTLEHNGESFSAAGMTPGMVLRDKDGNAITFTGTVEWADETESKIRFNPASTDFDADLSPYTLRWKVTDTEGKIAYYPQGKAIILRIYRQ